MDQHSFLTARSTLARSIAPLIGLLVLVFFVLPYVYGGDLYERVLLTVSIRPFPLPFADWEYQPAAAECWQKGVNVYIAAPCSVTEPNNPMTYSPIWLRLTFISPAAFWVNACGLGMALLYLACVAGFTPPASWWQLWVLTLTTVSSASILAIERGNVDVMIFLMIVLGVAGLRGGTLARTLGYALFVLAGLLKFYPIVLVAVAVRERFLFLVGIVLSTAAVLAWFLLTYADEIRMALANVGGSGKYFTNFIGAKILPFGLVEVACKAAHACGPGLAMPLVSYSILAGLLLATAGAAWYLARKGGMQAAFRNPADFDFLLLVASSVAVCGCFFTGNSLLYRGILLVLTLPGLFRLAATLPDASARWMVRVACTLCPIVCWVIGIQTLTNLFTTSGSVVRGLHWLLNELAWWWIIATLTGVIVGFALNAPSLAGLLSNRARHTGAVSDARTP